jgi:hypothetical protein
VQQWRRGGVSHAGIALVWSGGVVVAAVMLSIGAGTRQWDAYRGQLHENDSDGINEFLERCSKKLVSKPYIRLESYLSTNIWCYVCFNHTVFPPIARYHIHVMYMTMPYFTSRSLIYNISNIK